MHEICALDFTLTRQLFLFSVAMLTVVAHLHHVGLIGNNHRLDSSETAKKVVYIAPMKALAQEVVEKFSSKLKPLGMIVRELTGDMQLTRAAAEAANVIVTTPEKWDGMYSNNSCVMRWARSVKNFLLMPFPSCDEEVRD